MTNGGETFSFILLLYWSKHGSTCRELYDIFIATLHAWNNTIHSSFTIPLIWCCNIKNRCQLTYCVRIN